MTSPVIAKKGPYAVPVEKGKTYYWCSCGLSPNQPFCSGAHQGTRFRPVAYKAEETTTVYFCGCKHGKNGAQCDGSHKTLA